MLTNNHVHAREYWVVHCNQHRSNYSMNWISSVTNMFYCQYFHGEQLTVEFIWSGETCMPDNGIPPREEMMKSANFQSRNDALVAACWINLWFWKLSIPASEIRVRWTVFVSVLFNNWAIEVIWDRFVGCWILSTNWFHSVQSGLTMMDGISNFVIPLKTSRIWIVRCNIHVSSAPTGNRSVFVDSFVVASIIIAGSC